MIPIRDYNPSGTVPVVTMLLIVANVAAFIWETSQPPEELRTFVVREGGLVPLRAQMVLRGRAPGQGAAVVRSVFISMFLHGGILHLLGNMWFLWIFGDNVEDRLGHFSFVLFYLACGVGAAIVHTATNFGSTEPCIGASGAISGVLGAYLVSFPSARIQTFIPLFGCLPVFVLVPAGFFLAFWFLAQFYLEAGNVAWQAHVGGFAVGLVLVLLLPERRGFRVRWRRASAA